jgi:hypothetical protein
MVFGKYKNEKKAFASHVGQTGAVQGPDTYVYHSYFRVQDQSVLSTLGRWCARRMKRRHEGEGDGEHPQRSPQKSLFRPIMPHHDPGCQSAVTDTLAARSTGPEVSMIAADWHSASPQDSGVESNQPPTRQARPTARHHVAGAAPAAHDSVGKFSVSSQFVTPTSSPARPVSFVNPICYGFFSPKRSPATPSTISFPKSLGTPLPSPARAHAIGAITRLAIIDQENAELKQMFQEALSQRNVELTNPDTDSAH